MVSFEGRQGPIRTNGDLVQLLFSSHRKFDAKWLELEGKALAPVASPSGMDHALAVRLERAARAVGSASLLLGLFATDEADRDLVDLSVQAQDLQSLGFPAGDDREFVVAVPDFSGALLVTADGFSLVAGVSQFTAAFIPEGIDEAKSRFARQANRMARSWPGLSQVAHSFPVRFNAWPSPEKVNPGTHVAEQLGLMESLDLGEISARTFVVKWLDARRRSLETGERVREDFSRILDAVFYAVESYPIDPDLREDGDPTDVDIVTCVRSELRSARML